MRDLEGRRRTAAAVALAVAGLVLGTGCGSSPAADQARTTVVAPTTVAPPAPLAGADQPAAPVGPGTRLYFLRDGALAASKRGVDLAGDPEAALRLLLAGPAGWERDAGLDTAIQPNVSLLSFRVDGDTAVVDLSRTFETHATRPQVAQVVYTLTAYPTITRVKFLVDGQDNGATGVPPQGREAQQSVLPPLFLEGPTPWAPVSAPLQLAGTLARPADTYRYAVTAADGTVLVEGTAHARLGDADRRPFHQLIDLPGAPAGGATVTVTVSVDGEAPVRVPVTFT